MKQLAKVAVVVFALTFALTAFAAQKSLTVYSDTTLNGQKVAPGDYKVDYEINGGTAQVKLLQGKKTVATAVGQVVEQSSAPSDSAIVKSNNPDGSSSIVELQLAKVKSSIRFAPEQSEKGK